MAWCHFDELGTLHGLLFVASCGFKLFVLLWWYIDSVMPQCTISVFDDDDDVHMHISFFISALSWIFAEVVCVSSSSINDGSFWKWFRVYELTLKPTAFFSLLLWHLCVCRVEMKSDPSGRPYYVDHNTQTTSWTRPSPLPPGFAFLSCYIYLAFYLEL